MPILQTSATVSDGDNNIVATALVGVDLAQKGMQVPQQFGSASSYGKKICIRQFISNRRHSRQRRC